MEHSSGKIYLSEQRGQIESPLFQRNCIFNFGSYFNAHKTALGPLYLFNEENLAGTAQLEMEVSKPSYVILIPVTGDLEYTDVETGKMNVPVGQVLVRKCPADHLFRIGNPYTEEVISLIQIWISAADISQSSTLMLDLAPGVSPNRLVELSAAVVDAGLPFKLSAGQFDGRAETIYRKEKDSLLFCYVVAGAFEVEGRLLHAQDGLALWDTETLELEALSNNALMLTLEY
ncbi:pirin family protein [Pedobacter sp. GR22-6]|uniref:pirin family protein n=1 Tax=Pedobacter sp. GR22-6 TaxID=3127957 RepID=UPI00307FA135